MNKLLKTLFIFGMLVLTGLLIKPTQVSAEEISINEKTPETNQMFYKYEEGENDPNNQIIYTSNPTLQTSTNTTKAFTYNFENYVKTQYVFNGDACRRLDFTFNTTTWSGSNGFYVEMYDYFSDEFITKMYVAKSYSNPTTVGFVLEEGTSYRFKFDNTSYGEQIVGSGSWTAYDR